MAGIGVLLDVVLTPAGVSAVSSGRGRAAGASGRARRSDATTGHAPGDGRVEAARQPCRSWTALTSKPRPAMSDGERAAEAEAGDADPAGAVLALRRASAGRSDLGEGPALARSQGAGHGDEAAHASAVGEQIGGDGVEAAPGRTRRRCPGCRR